jgi:molybdopterin converting factor small subunit
MKQDSQTQDSADTNVPDIAKLFGQIAEKIIEQQEAIIGPIAVQQAQRVGELTIDWPQHEVAISGNPQTAIDELVEKYKELFGQIAVETCKDAVSRYLAQLSADQVPSSLK